MDKDENKIVSLNAYRKKKTAEQLKKLTEDSNDDADQQLTWDVRTGDVDETDSSGVEEEEKEAEEEKEDPEFESDWIEVLDRRIDGIFMRAFLPMEEDSQDKTSEQLMKAKKRKRRKSTVNEAMIVVALCLVLFGISLTPMGAAALNMNYWFRSDGKNITTVIRDRNDYGKRYTPDIMEQYEKAYEEVGVDFYIPLYVPKEYVLSKIATVPDLQKINFTFSHKDKFFNMTQTSLTTQKDVISRIAISDNVVHEKEISNGDNPIKVYNIKYENGNEQVILQGVIGVSFVQLTANVPEEEAIHIYKDLISFKEGKS